MRKLIWYIAYTYFICIFVNFSHTNAYTENTELNIKKAQLISNYITELEDKIILFKKKYSLWENVALSQNIVELDTMKNALNSISTTQVDKDIAEKVTVLVIQKLKSSKEKIETILRGEKQNFETRFAHKKDFYNKVCLQLNKTLNQIIIVMYNNLKTTDIDNNGISKIGSNENKTIWYLKDLNEDSLKLKNFISTSFNNEEEMTNTLIQILRDIKENMLAIKKIWSK